MEKSIEIVARVLGELRKNLDRPDYTTAMLLVEVRDTLAAEFRFNNRFFDVRAFRQAVGDVFAKPTTVLIKPKSPVDALVSHAIRALRAVPSSEQVAALRQEFARILSEHAP